MKTHRQTTSQSRAKNADDTAKHSGHHSKKSASRQQGFSNGAINSRDETHHAVVANSNEMKTFKSSIAKKNFNQTSRNPMKFNFTNLDYSVASLKGMHN